MIPAEYMAYPLLRIDFSYDLLNIITMSSSKKHYLIYLRHLEEKSLKSKPLHRIYFAFILSIAYLNLVIIFIELLIASEDECFIKIKH